MKKNLFGENIKFTHYLVRELNGVNRTWVSKPYGLEKTKGIIIGVRTLWNGEIVREAVDDGYARVFIFKESIKAYLVAVNLKTNPIYVLENDIIK